MGARANLRNFGGLDALRKFYSAILILALLPSAEHDVSQLALKRVEVDAKPARTLFNRVLHPTPKLWPRQTTGISWVKVVERAHLKIICVSILDRNVVFLPTSQTPSHQFHPRNLSLINPLAQILFTWGTSSD